MAETTTIEPKPVERLNEPFTNRVMDDDFVSRFNDAIAKDKAAGDAKKGVAPATKPADAPPADPPKPVAAAVPAPSEDDLPPDIAKSPKASEHWKRLKDAHKTELAAARAELETLKGRTPEKDPAAEQLRKDLEAAKKEAAEFSDQLRMLDVERHPKFKAYYENLVGTAIAQVKAIVGPEKFADISELLTMPDSARRTALIDAASEGMSQIQAGRLSSVLNRLEEIRIERDGEIQKARDNFAKVEADRAAAVKTEQERVAKTFDTVVSGLNENWVPFKTKDGDEKWNADVKARLDEARRIYSGELSLEDSATAALQAAAVPFMISGMQAMAARNKALEEELAALKTATPKPSAGAGDTAAVPDEKSTGDFRSDVERRAAEAGLFQGR